jgi:hypothetical protein
MATTTRTHATTRTAQRVIRIRDKSWKQIKDMAETYRGLSLVEVIDVLIDGWSHLTPEQQANVLTRPARKSSDS